VSVNVGRITVNGSSGMRSSHPSNRSVAMPVAGTRKLRVRRPKNRFPLKPRRSARGAATTPPVGPGHRLKLVKVLDQGASASPASRMCPVHDQLTPSH
jgi:hypothetical protein